MDFLKVLVIIAFILCTICTIKLHPGIHQPMLIEDADFKLTRISDTLTTDNIPIVKSENTTKNVEVQNEQNISLDSYRTPVPETKYVQTEEIQPEKTEQQVKIKNVNPKPRQVTNTSQPKKNTSKDVEMSDTEMLQQILKGLNEQTQEETPKPKPTPKPQQKPVQTTQPKTSSNFKNPYMTEQEEIIAWNKWRSNIHNQIMRDSNIDYAPLGTAFIFTFIVDKFGNVSNVKVECSNPNFQTVARNKVKPAITNLQKKPILNFPRGTQRTSTIVTGAFVIGTQERYSTPNDYSDYERVKY